MNSGVSKSGSPAPRSITARPIAFSSLARAETAIVADSRSAATFGEGTKARVMTVGAGGVGERARLYFESLASASQRYRGPTGRAIFPTSEGHRGHRGGT